MLINPNLINLCHVFVWLHYWSFYFHSDKNYNNPLSELLRHLFLGIVISVISSGISYRSCIALGTELTDTLFCFRTFGIAKKKVHKCIFILETLSLFAKEMEFICLWKLTTTCTDDLGSRISRWIMTKSGQAQHHQTPREESNNSVTRVASIGIIHVRSSVQRCTPVLCVQHSANSADITTVESQGLASPQLLISTVHTHAVKLPY